LAGSSVTLRRSPDVLASSPRARAAPTLFPSKLRLPWCAAVPSVERMRAESTHPTSSRSCLEPSLPPPGVPGGSRAGRRQGDGPSSPERKSTCRVSPPLVDSGGAVVGTGSLERVGVVPGVGGLPGCGSSAALTFLMSVCGLVVSSEALPGRLHLEWQLRVSRPSLTDLDVGTRTRRPGVVGVPTRALLAGMRRPVSELRSWAESTQRGAWLVAFGGRDGAAVEVLEMAKMQQSGCTGDAQKGPTSKAASSSAGSQRVKGGAGVRGGPKGGPRSQQSGGRGG
jgi:hypothetical protein